jgi:hypothetical protein
MRFTKRLNTGTVALGGKRVPVRKITVGQWQDLFGVIHTLPQLLISVMTAPASERAGYLVIALKESLEDVLNVVAMLTDTDADWLRENAALDELVAFFAETAKVNNFGELLKNVQGVLKLPAATRNPAQVDAP